MSTVSAATSAFNVSRPSDGGQSIRTKSNRSRAEASSARAGGARVRSWQSARSPPRPARDSRATRTGLRWRSAGCSRRRWPALARAQGSRRPSRPADLSPSGRGRCWRCLVGRHRQRECGGRRGQTRRKIDSGRRLSDAALLVGNRYDLGWQGLSSYLNRARVGRNAIFGYSTKHGVYCGLESLRPVPASGQVRRGACLWRAPLIVVPAAAHLHVMSLLATRVPRGTPSSTAGRSRISSAPPAVTPASPQADTSPSATGVE